MYTIRHTLFCPSAATQLRAGLRLPIQGCTTIVYPAGLAHHFTLAARPKKRAQKSPFSRRPPPFAMKKLTHIARAAVKFADMRAEKAIF